MKRIGAVILAAPFVSPALAQSRPCWAAGLGRCVNVRSTLTESRDDRASSFAVFCRRTEHVLREPELSPRRKALARSLEGIRGNSYRPELHYMRGPGPRWRERHAAATAQANVLNGTIAELRTRDVPPAGSAGGRSSPRDRPPPWSAATIPSATNLSQRVPATAHIE